MTIKAFALRRRRRPLLCVSTTFHLIAAVSITALCTIMPTPHFGMIALPCLAVTALETTSEVRSKTRLQLPYAATHFVKEDSSFLDKLEECSTCLTDLQCQSNICSSTFQCSASDGLGGSGCRCLKDDDCRSGFCTWKFQCEAKLAQGETGCTENDDCADGLFCAPQLDLDGLTECKPKLDMDSACATDDQCRSGDCGFRDAACPRCCVGTNMPTPTPTTSSPTPLSSGSYQRKNEWNRLGMQITLLAGMGYWSLEF